MREQAEWGAEYISEATDSECTAEAGCQKREKGMSFPNVTRESDITKATFDMRAYVKDLLLALALGIGGFSLNAVVFQYVLNFAVLRKKYNF